MKQKKLLSLFLIAVVASVSGGCGDRAADDTDQARSASDGAAVAGGTAANNSAEPAAPQSLVIAGRVSMADGSPPRGDIKDITISIQGVSEAGERVQYSPAVGTDGAYKQKVVPGQYSFSQGRISVIYNGSVQFDLPLEPVGGLWRKDRDAADGIVQDWVWKVTGPTPYGISEGSDPTNATHWYGMSIQLKPAGWRNDTNKPPTEIPDGSKLVFTLKPTTKSVDGRDVEPVVVERVFSSDTLYDPDINDLTPASYEMSGEATLPDGTVKPLLLQGSDEYPGYKPAVAVVLEKDNIIGGMFKPPIDFIIE